MARDGYIVMSIVFYIAGLIYIILPEISPMTICISSGIALIAYGIIKIIGYCSNDLYCLAFQYDLACGIFLIVLGVIMLCSSTKLIPYLSVGLGALVLLDSLLTIQTSKDAKQFGLQTWHMIFGYFRSSSTEPISASSRMDCFSRPCIVMASPWLMQA